MRVGCRVQGLRVVVDAASPAVLHMRGAGKRCMRARKMRAREPGERAGELVARRGAEAQAERDRIKEAYTSLKRDLYWWQKRPISRQASFDTIVGLFSH